MPENTECARYCDAFRALELLICIACLVLVMVLVNNPPPNEAWPWMLVLLVMTFGGIGVVCAIDIICGLIEGPMSPQSAVLMCLVAIGLFLASGGVCIILYTKPGSGVIELILALLAFLTAILFFINVIHICGTIRERRDSQIYPVVLQVANPNPPRRQSRRSSRSSYSKRTHNESDTSLHDVVADGRGDKAPEHEPQKQSEQPQIIYVNPAMERRRSSTNRPPARCLHYMDDYDSHTHISNVHQVTQASNNHGEPMTHSSRTVDLKCTEESAASEDVHSIRTEKTQSATLENPDEAEPGRDTAVYQPPERDMAVYQLPERVSHTESGRTSLPRSSVERDRRTSRVSYADSDRATGHSSQVESDRQMPCPPDSQMECIRRPSSGTIPGDDNHLVEILDVVVQTKDVYVRVSSTKNVASTPTPRSYKKPLMVIDSMPSEVHQSDAHDQWSAPSNQSSPKTPTANEAPKTPTANEAPKTPTANEAPKTPTANEATQTDKECNCMLVGSISEALRKQTTPITPPTSCCGIKKSPVAPKQSPVRPRKGDCTRCTPVCKCNVHDNPCDKSQRSGSRIINHPSNTDKKTDTGPETSSTHQDNVSTRTVSQSYQPTPSYNSVVTKEESKHTQNDSVVTKEESMHTQNDSVVTKEESMHTQNDSVVTKEESMHTQNDSVKNEENVQGGEEYTYKEVLESQVGPVVTITKLRRRNATTSTTSFLATPHEVHSLASEPSSQGPSLPDSASTGHTIRTDPEPIHPDDNALVILKPNVTKKCACHHHDIINDYSTEEINTVMDVSPQKDAAMKEISLREPPKTNGDISVLQRNDDHDTPKTDESQNCSHQANIILETRKKSVVRIVSVENVINDIKHKSEQQIVTKTSVEKYVNLEMPDGSKSDTSLTGETTSTRSIDSSQSVDSTSKPITPNQIRKVDAQATKTMCHCEHNDHHRNQPAQGMNLEDKARPQTVPKAQIKLGPTIKIYETTANNTFSRTQIRYRYDLIVDREVTGPHSTAVLIHELGSSKNIDPNGDDNDNGETSPEDIQEIQPETETSIDPKESKEKAKCNDTTHDTLMEETLENDTNYKLESISQGGEQCNCRNPESKIQECNCGCPCCGLNRTPRSEESDVPENWRNLDLPKSSRSKSSASARTTQLNTQSSTEHSPSRTNSISKRKHEQTDSHWQNLSPQNIKVSEDPSLNNLLGPKSSNKLQVQNGRGTTSTLTKQAANNEKDVDELLKELDDVESVQLTANLSSRLTTFTEESEVSTTEVPSDHSTSQWTTSEMTEETTITEILNDPLLAATAETSGNIGDETDSTEAKPMETDNDSHESIMAITKQTSRKLERGSKDTSNKKMTGPKIPVRPTRGSKTVRTSTVTKVKDRYISSYGGVFPVDRDAAPMAHSPCDSMRRSSTRRSESPPTWQRSRPCGQRQCYTTRPSISQNYDDIPVRGLVLPPPPRTPCQPVRPCQYQSAMTSPSGRARIPHDEIPVKGLPTTEYFFAPSARVCQRCGRYHDPGSNRSQVTVPVMCPNMHVHGTVDVDLTRTTPTQSPYAGRLSNYQPRYLPPPESYNRNAISPTPYVIPPDNTCARILSHETLRRQSLDPIPKPMPSPAVFILGRANVDDGRQQFGTTEDEDCSCAKIREIHDDDDDDFYPEANERLTMTRQYNNIAANTFGPMWRELQTTERRVETEIRRDGRRTPTSSNGTTGREMHRGSRGSRDMGEEEETRSESFSSMEEEPSEHDSINDNSNLIEESQVQVKQRSRPRSVVYGEYKLVDVRGKTNVATRVQVEPFLQVTHMIPVQTTKKPKEQKPDDSQASTSKSKPKTRRLSADSQERSPRWFRPT